MASAVPVNKSAEANSIQQDEAKPENTPESTLAPGSKRKRACSDASGPPAKKILGDGTRLSGTPVTWKSSSTGIVIKLVNCPNLIQMQAQ